MKKIKSVLAVLFAACTIFLSGCAVIPAQKPANDSDFFEITEVSERISQYTSVDISDENILFLGYNNIDAYRLIIYNAEKGTITAEKVLDDCALKNIHDAKFTQKNEISVVDYETEQSITYDLNLNETGTADYNYENDYDTYETAPKNDFITDRFNFLKDYAIEYDYDTTACIFYDELDYTYLSNLEGGALDNAGKKILFTEFNEDEDADRVYIDDYENAIRINEVQTNANDKNCLISIADAKINEDYACLVLQKENLTTGGVCALPYLWKYTENAKNTPLDIQKLTAEDIDNQNNQLADTLKDNYGINTYINTPSEFDYGYEIEYNADALSVHFLLSQLINCLNLFPDGFIDDMTADFCSQFNIYIVGHISDVNAFTYAFPEFDIVFSTSGFYRNVIFHELAHLMETGINSYYEDEELSFYEQWEALNPEGFLYFNENNDFDDESFVSWYAMTNVSEDMAETFQTLCELSVDEAYDFADPDTGVYKKAALLCRAIRNAFPSTNSNDKNFWEKNIEFDIPSYALTK